MSAPGTRRIDLNADLGEALGVWRLGDDDALLDLVTSANVACGFHAGDPLTMRAVCASAVAGGVSIGAQVAYRDLAGFDRRFVDVAPHDLTADVLYPLAALDGIGRAAGGRVSYVKPHGALYDAGLALPGLPGSALLRRADDAGLRTVPEGFADRGYTPGGTLVPRGGPGAVLRDPAGAGGAGVGRADRGPFAT